MKRANEAGRTTLAVDYTAETLGASPESQRALQQLRDEVVAGIYVDVDVDVDVDHMFEEG